MMKTIYLLLIASTFVVPGRALAQSDLDGLEFELEAIEWQLVFSRLELIPDQSLRPDSEKDKTGDLPRYASVSDIQNYKDAWNKLKAQIKIPEGAIGQDGVVVFGWRPITLANTRDQTTVVGFETDSWPGEGKGLWAAGASNRAHIVWTVAVFSSLNYEGDLQSMLQSHFMVLDFSVTLHPISMRKEDLTPEKLETLLRAPVPEDAPVYELSRLAPKVEDLNNLQGSASRFQGYAWDEHGGDINNALNGGLSTLELPDSAPRSPGVYEIRVHCVVQGQVGYDDEPRRESVSGAIRFAFLPESFDFDQITGERKFDLLKRQRLWHSQREDEF